MTKPDPKAEVDDQADERRQLQESGTRAWPVPASENPKPSEGRSAVRVAGLREIRVSR